MIWATVCSYAYCDECSINKLPFSNIKSCNHINVRKVTMNYAWQLKTLMNVININVIVKLARSCFIYWLRFATVSDSTYLDSFDAIICLTISLPYRILLLSSFTVFLISNGFLFKICDNVFNSSLNLATAPSESHIPDSHTELCSKYFSLNWLKM